MLDLPIPNELYAIHDRQKVQIRDVEERIEAAERRIEADRVRYAECREDLETQLARSKTRLENLRRNVCNFGDPSRLKRKCAMYNRTKLEQKVLNQCVNSSSHSRLVFNT